jgi:molecular chaperone GrpE
MSQPNKDEEAPSVSGLPEAPQEEQVDSSTSMSSALDTEALKKQLSQVELEKKEVYEKYLRTYAEFENFKKRIAKEQSDQSRYANERLLRALLPVLDNLARAISHSKESGNLDKLVEGLELTEKAFVSVLNKFGVAVIESLGRPFDPVHHQAMIQVETDEKEENTVVEEFQRGYLLHDRVLRPALVSVAKNRKKAASPLPEQETEKTPAEKNHNPNKEH